MSAEDFALTLELDPAKDGSWSQDETSRFFKASTRRGRSDALSPMRPGRTTLNLSNRDGRFAPDKGIITDLDNYTPIRLYGTWTTPAVTNIDDNPSAETDTVGWQASGSSLARVTDESWAGGACVKYTVTDANEVGCFKNKRDGNRFAVTAGQPYMWAPRVRGSSGKNMKIVLFWYNSGGSLIQRDEAAFTFGDGWIQPTLTITAPTGAVTVWLAILTDGAQGAFDFWVDASWLYQGSTLLPYVDGDRPGCSWSGTAHESTSSRSANPTFPLFQGFIVDFDLKEDALDRTAVLTCIDRMALWPQINVTLGNMLKKASGVVLNRLTDLLEGELISNPGIEWTELSANPGTGWTAVGSSLLGFSQITASGSEDEAFEGDWVLLAQNDGVAAGEGMRYDATSDVPAVGKYEAAKYARAVSGTVQVKFRFLRDAVEEASIIVTLTTSWQRIPLSIDFSTLGTNRYFELITNVTSAVDFRADALHCVAKANAIERDFDAGAATLELVNAYHDPISAIIGDVLESEPGFMFVKAQSLSEGDALAFRDRNSRPSSEIPRVVFGDGDGLLQFANGLNYDLAGADRVASVTVTSRGTPSLGTGKVPGWEMAPKRTTTAGEEFLARYTQTLRRVLAIEKGGVDIEHENKNFGSGHDIEVLTGAAGSYFVFEGYPYDFPTASSSVTKRDASSSLPVKNHLSVQMPLQGTVTQDMKDEADRLLAKYKDRVVRLVLPLHQRNDEVQAFQLDAELNDQVVIRAKFKDHSPGFDKKFWIEGIEHTIDGRGGTIQTALLLEEA